jgi:inositol-hexakisphosphate/diphosphoinositol-pentakisphosphate 1-kinase
MHHDLIWWSESEPKKTGEEEIKTEEDCKLEEEKEEFWNRTEAKTHNIKQSAWKHVRTRLYFTSASHLYTLFNTLHLGLDSMLMDPSTKNKPNPMDEINRLDYLSHIIFRLYENSTVSEVIFSFSFNSHRKIQKDFA